MNEIVFTTNQLALAIISLLGLMGGYFKWATNQSHNERICTLERETEDGKERDRITIYALSAILAGLREQGCNGPVREAQEMLDEYLKEKSVK